MKILITGAKGFVGHNLVSELENIRCRKDKTFELNPDFTILQYDIDTDPALLDEYCHEADFVFHLAGVNRPKDPKEFMTGNFGFTSMLLDTLKKHNNNCTVMLSSSIQAILDNPYGKSKKAGEELLFVYGRETGAKVLVYRFPNVFGKWCRPNYNSAIATFCNNIAQNLPIMINDRKAELHLVYIDDVVTKLIHALEGKENTQNNYSEVAVTYTATLWRIVDLLYSFKESRKNLCVPDMEDGFSKKLYSTYLSYLPTDSFSYPLKMNTDSRGSFTEFLKSSDKGQVSINISKPGITKGNHWHHSKNEKFLVVSGKGIIRFRKIDSNEIYEYRVSGDKLEVVDIPTGYTHNIENLGDEDMVTVMWVNEVFDPKHPDTFSLNV